MFDRDVYENFLLDLPGCVGFFDPPITLKSGRPGHWYVDMRQVLGSLQTKRQLAGYIYQFCMEHDLQPDYFLGVPQGATPLGEELNNLIGYKLPENIPAAILRSGKKAHGKPQDRNSVGSLMPGSHIVLVEDVSTTGGSSMEYILNLQEVGVFVDALVPCVSRHERRDHGRTVEDVIKRDYHVRIFAPITDAKTLLPKAVLRYNPPQKLRDETEAYYRKYGVSEIELPKAA